MYKMDVAKAFDSVSWKQLRLAIAPFLYEETHVDILIGAVTQYQLECNGERIRQEHGVLQGDPFSNVALALMLFKAFQQRREILQWHNFFVYVDDITGTAETTHEALRRMKVIRSVLLSLGLRVALLKSAVAVLKHADFSILGFPLGGSQRVHGHVFFSPNGRSVYERHRLSRNC